MQCLQAAQQIELDATPSVEDDLLATAMQQLSRGEPTAVVTLTLPSLKELIELSHAARGQPLPVVLALPAPEPRRKRLLDVAGDLGIVALSELRPLTTALALLGRGGQEAYGASARALSVADRARVKPGLFSGSKAAGQLVPVDAGQIGWTAQPDTGATALGEARDVAEALLALRAVERSTDVLAPSVEGIDPALVLDVIFGPRRALSDPASKTALAPYGIPLPVEELCASPSRAAAEATRIGFPVRISLASPDLRIWDHPDLSVDMVDNAARVRDTFRQLVALAHARLVGETGPGSGSDARVLGVLVTATSEANATLWVRATPVPRAHVAMELGFADPHGRAANDSTLLMLPAPASAIERALRRLQGADLIFATSPAQRKARLDAVRDVLLRLSAFVHERREEIECVELRPVALLMDGSAEVREACVTVSDCFERSLATPTSPSPQP